MRLSATLGFSFTTAFFALSSCTALLCLAKQGNGTYCQEVKGNGVGFSEQLDS